MKEKIPAQTQVSERLTPISADEKKIMKRHTATTSKFFKKK